jgi:hypothetical protein
LFAGGGGGYGRRELRKSGIEVVASIASAMANDEGGAFSSDEAGGTGDAPGVGAGEDDEDGSVGILAWARSEPSVSGCGDEGVSRAVMSFPLEGAPGKGECLKRGMAASRGVAWRGPEGRGEETRYGRCQVRLNQEEEGKRC